MERPHKSPPATYLETVWKRAVSAATGDDEAGVPSWSAPSYWRPNHLGSEAAPRDQPRDDRVRVPHLSCAHFVATPDKRRQGGHKVEQSLRLTLVVAQPLWTLYRLGDVGDDAVTPAAHLVAKDPETSRPAAPNRALSHDTTPRSVAKDRRLLDDESPVRHADLKRRVVEVARGTPRAPCCDRLVDASVQTYGVTTRTQRKPVQIDAAPSRQFVVSVFERSLLLANSRFIALTCTKV